MTQHPPTSVPGDGPRLSFAQERLWFLEQLVPGTAIHNVPVAVRITGNLDADVLIRALAEIVRRHATLRTAFEVDDNGVPAQIVTPDATVPVPVTDLGDVDAGARDAALERVLQLEVGQPFDLGCAPLIRARLVRLDGREHVFVMTLHHIVSDGWSIGVLIRELTALYEAFVAGRPSPLPAVAIQYADFAREQRERLAGEELERQLTYWRGQLAGATPGLSLPADRPRPATPSFRGGRCAVTLSREPTAAVKAVGRRHGATLFMTLLAAFDALLHRYGGDEDIVVGTPIANRNRLEIEGLIGFFVNTLALRVDTSGDPSFGDLLRRVRRVALEAYAHQDLPFEKIVEDLRPDRAVSQAPLFEAMLVLQNAPSGPLSLPGLEVRPLEVHTPTAKFDLLLAVTERDGELCATLEYDLDRFDPATAERILKQYETLLEHAAAEPELPVSRLRIVAPDEQDRLITLGARLTEYPPRHTLPDLFSAQVARTPEAIALTFQGSQMTYAELDRRTDRAAERLRAVGAGPGSLVGLLLERSLELPVAILAVLKAGAAYVPLDPSHPRARLEATLADANPSLLLTQPTLAASAPPAACPVLQIDADGALLGGIVAARERGRRAAPDDLAYVIYTSGSTGSPKGVEITHHNVVRLFAAARDGYALGERDVWTLFHSYAFDVSVWELWGALLHGGRLVIVPRDTARAAESFYELLCAEGVTVLNQTPSAFAALAGVDARRQSRELALRLVIFAGESLDPRLLRSWMERHGDAHPRLVNMYGITETTVHVTRREMRAADVEKGSRSLIGSPLPDLSLHVLDAAMRPVPPGVTGELYVGGAGVARGYLGAPELTARRFLADPFSDAPGARLYRSGDLARRAADGELEYLGRCDNQVKIRGFRIELGDVESALLEHPSVSAAAVNVTHGLEGDARLAAYVVPEAAQEPPHVSGEEHVDTWQLVFDQAYGAGTSDDASFDTAGWRHSASGEPISDADMREWVDDRVRRIRTLQPRRVLEIGCGTGLLLHRLAPTSERYWGTDLAANALRAVRRERRTLAHPDLRLLHRPAHDLSGIEPGSFDVVVLNSVVQYFPSATYLADVLRAAVETVRGGGAVFIGDVRNHALIEAFHAHVELERADDAMLLTQLRQQVRRRVADDDELLLDPAFFTALADDLPGAIAVETQLLGGRARNEMTCFRYDVVLHVDGDQATVAPTERIDGRAGVDLGAIRRRLLRERPESLLIEGVPNVRLTASVEAARRLAAPERGATVAHLRRALAEQGHSAAEPADVWALADVCGYSARVDWTGDGGDGRFDAVLRRRGASVEVRAPAVAREPAAPPSLASSPAAVRRRRRLVPELRGFLAGRVPEHMLPSSLMIVDELPITANGKLDRSALPPLDHERPQLETAYVAPRTPTETQVAAACAELLGLGQVGAQDNFFDLGGHSLLATQLLFRLRDSFDVNLPLRALFDTPTVAGIAAALDVARRRPEAAIVAARRDLRADAVLDPAIVARKAPPRTGGAGHVLVTGATGFLGAFVVRELVRQTAAPVHCLVRASDAASALRRVRENLGRYGLLNADVTSRVVAVPGDLALPLLGLGAEEFDALARGLDAVYHSGATVNLVQPYHQLRDVNVRGTQEIQRLAARAGAALHHVSTVGVFSAADAARTIGEEHPLGTGEDLEHGYAQSKWVAEQLVREGSARGLPSAVYRPSRICGDSHSGACQQDDFLWRIVKGCVEVGAAPAVDAPLDLVPVDYVSQAIVALAQRAEPDGSIYHVVSPAPVRLAGVMDDIASLGYPLERMPLEAWHELIAASPDNAAFPLLSVLSDDALAGGLADVPFDDARAQAALAGSGVRCPAVDRALLQTYLSYFARVGFLPAPTASLAA